MPDSSGVSAASQSRLKDLCRCFGHAPSVIRAFYPDAPFLSQKNRRAPVVEEFTKSRREGGCILRFKKQASPACRDHFGKSASRGGDNRETAGHRFEKVNTLRLDETGRYGKKIDAF